MANTVGKRYVCKKCGVELMVTRGGNGTLQGAGQPMGIKKGTGLRGVGRVPHGGDAGHGAGRQEG